MPQWLTPEWLTAGATTVALVIAVATVAVSLRTAQRAESTALSAMASQKQSADEAMARQERISAAAIASQERMAAESLDSQRRLVAQQQKAAIRHDADALERERRFSLYEELLTMLKRDVVDVDVVIQEMSALTGRVALYASDTVSAEFERIRTKAFLAAVLGPTGLSDPVTSEDLAALTVAVQVSRAAMRVGADVGEGVRHSDELERGLHTPQDTDGSAGQAR